MVTILNREINNFYDLPFIGPWPLKAGKILRLWASPCSPTPEIWVLAFWHDAPWLVWSIIKPESIDKVTERLGVGHHRKRRKRFPIVDKFPPRFPVPKNAIGWATFPVIQAKERLGWYLLIVDATLDFAINWQSTAYQWTGCQVEDAHWCKGVAQDEVQSYALGIHDSAPLWGERSMWGFFQTIGNSITTVNYDVSVGVSLNYRTAPPDSPHFIQFTAQLVDYETGWVLDEVTPREQPDGSFSGSMLTRDWSATKPKHTYGIRLNVTHGRDVNWLGSVIDVYGHKQKGLKFDP